MAVREIARQRKARVALANVFEVFFDMRVNVFELTCEFERV